MARSKTATIERSPITNHEVLSAETADQAQPPAAAAKSAPAAARATVYIRVVHGGIVHVKADIAVVPRYQGLPLAGQAKDFDLQLDSWLTRAVDLGMIGSGLGQLFFVRLDRRFKEGKSNVETLILAGMGEPGHFATDDLRYLMSNVTVAVKSMRQKVLITSLIGSRRNELPISHAVRSFLQGILDGYETFRAIAEAVTDHAEEMRHTAEDALQFIVVDSDKGRAQKIHDAFTALVDDVPNMQLEVSRGDDVPCDPVTEARGSDTDPEVPVTFLRVTRADQDGKNAGPSESVAFQFSAMSDTAVVTVRNSEVNPYFVRELPDRLISTDQPGERESLGVFFANYLVPEDFRKLIESDASITLVVDQSTAAFPWEMTAYKKFTHTNYLATTTGLSRQFRTLLSPPPSSPPPLNRVFKILIIADPGSGRLSLPNARQEGLAVLSVIDQARRAWNGEFTMEATVRLGSRQSQADLEPMFERIRKLGDWVHVKVCDPLELAVLIVNEQFDAIHYAGHGAFYPSTQRAGWLLDEGCFLTAQEIFRVRQVPRLVFANACFSAATTDAVDPRGQLVGLAQAFFARGIPNYIGTGWTVDDECARECARWFYARILGLKRPDADGTIIGTSPPATIGDALLETRKQLFEQFKASSTWAAYQHYGRVADKVLPLPNQAKI